MCNVPTNPRVRSTLVLENLRTYCKSSYSTCLDRRRAKIFRLKHLALDSDACNPLTTNSTLTMATPAKYAKI
jgi:hypothetical protein